MSRLEEIKAELANRKQPVVDPPETSRLEEVKRELAKRERLSSIKMELSNRKQVAPEPKPEKPIDVLARETEEKYPGSISKEAVGPRYTAEQQAVPTVGADPKAGFVQNMVEAALNPAEALTMAGTGAITGAMKGGVKQAGKQAVEYGTMGLSNVAKGGKEFLKAALRRPGKIEKLRPPERALPLEEVTKRFMKDVGKPGVAGARIPIKTGVEELTTQSPKTILPDEVERKLESVLSRSSKTLGPKGKDPNKLSWDMVRSHYRTKWGLDYEYTRKWKDELRDKYTPDELEDMMFYRERTGNIFKKNYNLIDSFEALNQRLSTKAKNTVDNVVDEHISNNLKAWNASPFTKDISARKEVEEIYLSHVYDGNIKPAYEHAMGVIGKKFKTDNPFRNKRTYLTFQDALRERGLLPKFRNLADQLDYQDKFTTRLLANNELLGKTKLLEKYLGTKLIVRPGTKGYDKYAKEGYEAFNDPFLRTYVAGKKEGGKLIHAVRHGPALLHPDYADAVRSVFQKDAYKPENIAWKGYDVVNAWIKNIRVSLSGFHLVPLAESLVGGKGVKSLNLHKWWKGAGKILDDPVRRKELAEAGVKLTAPGEVHRGLITGGINRLVNKADAAGAAVTSKVLKTATKPYLKFQSFLWDTYHPRIKASVYYDYKYKFLKEAEKQGRKFGIREERELNNQIGSLVNDQFGHQAWELQKHFNDPNVQKWMNRLVGYPDWTVSALRQAGSIGEKGVRGQLGRRYWLRYGVGYLLGNNLISYLNTGLHNDPQTGEVRWSPEKAHSTFENEDPLHKFNFQLPDVDFEIMGVKFNPGRASKDDGSPGRKLYSHFGKQMLEIGKYIPYLPESEYSPFEGDPISALFGKSSPLIQMVGKQIMGGSPYRGDIFPAQAGYKGGEYKAWEGTEPGSLARLGSRAKQVTEDVTPFSIAGMLDKGPSTLGMLPISKGISSYRAKDFMQDYMKNRDFGSQARIKKVLREGGYNKRQVKRTTTRAKNLLKEKNNEN